MHYLIKSLTFITQVPLTSPLGEKDNFDSV